MIGRTPLLLVLGGTHSGREDFVHERLRQLLIRDTVLHVAAEPGGDLTGALRGRRGIAVVLDDFAAALQAAWPADTERAEVYAIETADAMRAAAGMIAVIVSTEPEGAAADFGARLGAANRALAATAEEVVLVVAGLPVTLKTSEE